MDSLQSLAIPSLTSLTDQFDPSEDDLMLMKRVLGAAAARPDLLPTPFLAYLSDYLQAGDFSVTTNQIAGFARFGASFASIATAESENSNSGWTELPTIGPELTELADGNYVFIYGADCYTSVVGSGFSAQISLQVNLSGIVAGSAATTPTGDYVSIAKAITQPLSAGSNSVKLFYRSSGAPASTGFFQNRWLMALRYANL